MNMNSALIYWPSGEVSIIEDVRVKRELIDNLCLPNFVPYKTDSGRLESDDFSDRVEIHVALFMVCIKNIESAINAALPFFRTSLVIFN
jgi:hypothetical protein